MPNGPSTCGRRENAAAKSKQIRAIFSAGSWQLKTHAPQLKRREPPVLLVFGLDDVNA
jgi:hypothetical protein